MSRTKSHAVMFDFSGTLFRITSTAEWLAGALEATGIELPAAARDDLAARLERAGALPGGAVPEAVPDDLVPLWNERDLDARRHHDAFTAMSRLALADASLTDPSLADPSLTGLDVLTAHPDRVDELVEVLYQRHMSPAAWRPYPDAEATLKELRRREIPVAVVSNIGWDLRPVFREHGFDELVDAYVLSYEVGAAKPDPAIFQAAFTALGKVPTETLMVGDDAGADGGATALGCAFLEVAPLPVDQRPNGLTVVLDEV
ncbi:HAD-IA family hydrolase [Streptacidiphilus fuscans]|uniref:HAD-IA family hydrolase n=1 Tax=Streptacidiphilus fuscans TaxID=2789292 RepID=A0A931FHR0_9ACTN|nr:HAD-IA family hydrolase [Streptacidiphilus fuscans]MBF9072096.1 HAD-IA family hydrolase [Streptacidiphilus fuscans]